MPFADDLLEQAYHLANRETASPKQASLRRAVSTAYYALFHLLIDDAVGKWAVERQRSALARTFDHSKMKGVSEDVVKSTKSGSNLPPDLNAVAHNFIQLQQHRHTADYDNSKNWSHKEVFTVLDLATDAFSAWRRVCGEDAAQDYLLQLFLPKVLKTWAAPTKRLIAFDKLRVSSKRSISAKQVTGFLILIQQSKLNGSLSIIKRW